MGVRLGGTFSLSVMIQDDVAHAETDLLSLVVSAIVCWGDLCGRSANGRLVVLEYGQGQMRMTGIFQGCHLPGCFAMLAALSLVITQPACRRTERLSPSADSSFWKRSAGRPFKPEQFLAPRVIWNAAWGVTATAEQKPAPRD